MKLLYAHQVRDESDCKPFGLRHADVTVKTWPPDDVDFCETYQVIKEGRPISDAEINIETAFSSAAITLCWESRKAFRFS